MIKIKEIDDIYAIWKSNKRPHQDISTEYKLLLFDISQFITPDTYTPKQITFYSYYTIWVNSSVNQITKMYSEVEKIVKNEKKQLEIKFGAEYGKIPSEPNISKQ